MTIYWKNCRIDISFLLLAALAALLVSDRSGYLVAGLGAAALHEGAHLTVMNAYRCLPGRIRMTPFGIDILRGSGVSHSYLRDVAVSLSGPAVNLLAAAIFAFCPGCTQVTLANFALFCFNVLPIAPLDGGQALYALLCLKWSPRNAARAVTVISFFVLLPLAAVGFFALLRSPWNFSLLLVSIYLILLLLLKKEKYA